MKKTIVPYLSFLSILLIWFGIIRFRDTQRSETVIETSQVETIRNAAADISRTPPDKDVQLEVAAERFLKEPSDTSASNAAATTSAIDPSSRSRREPARIVDRLASYRELERHVAKIDEHTARVTRLLSTPLKYSQIRTTETVDTSTGEILSHTAESADHVIVKFQSDPRKQDLDFLLDSFGLSVRKKMQMEKTYIISIPNPDIWAIDRTTEALGKLDFVAFSEPDFIILDGRRK